MFENKCAIKSIETVLERSLLVIHRVLLILKVQNPERRDHFKSMAKAILQLKVTDAYGQ